MRNETTGYKVEEILENEGNAKALMTRDESEKEKKKDMKIR
jgi:hypothetical protein